jgi:hypothetical protein
MKHAEKPVAPSPPVAMSERERKADRQLDEALEETFPASDPIAISQPAPDNRVRKKK